MKLFTLVVATLLSIAGCSGFNKQVRRPSVEAYSSQFLYWCEGDGMWPVYISEPEDCEKVSRGIWDHYPLTVTAEDALIKETMEAIEAFNAQVGFTLFSYEETNLDPDIVVIDDGPRLSLYAVAKQLTVDGRHYGAVLTYNNLGASDRSDVMMHELGHLVGLRHDRYNPKSVMYHTDGLIIAALERQDIEALRTIYLGKQ